MGKFFKNQHVMVRIAREPDNWFQGFIHQFTDDGSITEVDTRLGRVDVKSGDLRLFDRERDLSVYLDASERRWMVKETNRRMKPLIEQYA